MKKDLLVSVVVPIFNVDKYLEACITSIQRQSYDNIEIILVDDGSTDCCGKICDECAKMDGRIKVIHKKNGGLSSARNAGIQIATGNCITFVDSDDYVSELYIEQLLSGLRDDIDVVICDMSEVENELSHKIVERGQKYSSDEALRYILNETTLNTSACAKLFRMCLFADVKFPEGKIYEDYATIPKIIAVVENILHYENNLYYYRPNPTSITSVQFSEKRMQYFEISDTIEKFISVRRPELTQLVIMRKTRYAISFYRQICKSRYHNFTVEKYLREIIRDNIVPYVFKTQYSFLSKLFGILIATFPGLTKVIH